VKPLVVLTADEADGPPVQLFTVAVNIPAPAGAEESASSNENSPPAPSAPSAPPPLSDEEQPGAGVGAGADAGGGVLRYAAVQLAAPKFHVLRVPDASTQLVCDGEHLRVGESTVCHIWPKLRGRTVVTNGRALTVTADGTARIGLIQSTTASDRSDHFFFTYTLKWRVGLLHNVVLAFNAIHLSVANGALVIVRVRSLRSCSAVFPVGAVHGASLHAWLCCVLHYPELQSALLLQSAPLLQSALLLQSATLHQSAPLLQAKVIVYPPSTGYKHTPDTSTRTVKPRELCPTNWLNLVRTRRGRRNGTSMVGLQLCCGMGSGWGVGETAFQLGCKTEAECVQAATVVTRHVLHDIVSRQQPPTGGEAERLARTVELHLLRGQFASARTQIDRLSLLWSGGSAGTGGAAQQLHAELLGRVVGAERAVSDATAVGYHGYQPALCLRCCSFFGSIPCSVREKICLALLARN
jgi:hypothetical protein